MSKQEAAKTQAQLLKELREKHAETVAKTQAHLKEQQAIRKQLRQVMGNSAMTIPEISSGSGLPANVVLWHITAMKKYDLVREVGRDGDYYQYAFADAKESEA